MGSSKPRGIRGIEGYARVNGRNLLPDHLNRKMRRLGPPRGKRRPRKPSAGRNIVGIRRNRLEELQVVSQADILRQARVHPPFVLREDACIRIGLGDYGVFECLGESRIVVCAGQESRERRE